MKCFFQNSTVHNKAWWWLSCFAFLLLIAGCRKGNEMPTLTITTVATGLAGPMGIETDRAGNIWVSEGGTGNDDGKVVVIKPNGKKYDAIINLSSITNPHSNELQGTVHLLLDGSTLYVLSGNFLYKANVSHFKPGDAPLNASNIPYEDIAAFVHDYPFVNDADDSHPYNLMKGPDGDLYIADAGANAIIHRKSAGNYSILAEIPAIANPLFPAMGGPMVQAVPTSIIYDGSDFLVTTLTGFPFPAGQAIIYKVSKLGNVSIYQKGFTMLVDQAEGNYANRLMVQHAASFVPPGGFAPNTGSLVWANGTTMKPVAEGLNMPVAIKQVNAHTWYVTLLGDGSVIKVTYN